MSQRWSSAIGRRLGDVERSVLLARARDYSMESRDRRTLVLAPHPDDETLGCGGTVIAKRDAGTRVQICIATDGRHSSRSRAVGPEALGVQRRAEARDACSRLGVPDSDLVFLGYEDGTLGAAYEALVSTLAGTIEELEPLDLFVPSAIDWHGDHRVLCAAAREAVAQSEVTPRILSYPVWFWSASSWADDGASARARRVQAVLRPLGALVTLRPFTVGISTLLGRKRDALAAYADELAPFGPVFLERFLRSEELFFELAPQRAESMRRG